MEGTEIRRAGRTALERPLAQIEAANHPLRERRGGEIVTSSRNGPEGEERRQGEGLGGQGEGREPRYAGRSFDAQAGLEGVS